MRYQRLVFTVIVATILLQVVVAIPVDDERGRPPSKRRSLGVSKNSIPSTRLRATEHDDDSESRTSGHASRREYGFDDKHGDDEEAHEKPRSRHYKNDMQEEGVRANSSSVHSQDALAGGILHALGRFFGFSHDSDKRSSSAASDRTSKAATHSRATEHSDKTSMLLDELEVEDAGSGEDWLKPSSSSHGGGRADKHAGRGGTTERWGEASSDEGVVHAKEGSEEDDEKADAKLADAPTPTPTPTPTSKAKESGEYMSEADVREMVGLFRKLFASLERTLDERAGAEVGVTGRVGQGVRGPWGKRGGGVLGLEAGAGEEDEGEGPGGGRWMRGRKEELPDVRLALAEAENLNRRREAERAVRMAEEEERRRAKDGIDEEEMPADEEEKEERTARDLPRAAPAYGARKRLLVSKEERREIERRERRSEWHGLVEAIAQGLTSVF